LFHCGCGVWTPFSLKNGKVVDNFNLYNGTSARPLDATTDSIQQ